VTRIEAEPGAGSAKSEPMDDPSVKAIAVAGLVRLLPACVKLDHGKSHPVESTPMPHSIWYIDRLQSEPEDRETPVVAVRPDLTRVPLTAVGHPDRKERRRDEECPRPESATYTPLRDEKSTEITSESDQAHTSRIIKSTFSHDCKPWEVTEDELGELGGAGESKGLAVRTD
jgi:hypothetical protein